MSVSPRNSMTCLKGWVSRYIGKHGSSFERAEEVPYGTPSGLSDGGGGIFVAHNTYLKSSLCKQLISWGFQQKVVGSFLMHLKVTIVLRLDKFEV